VRELSPITIAITEATVLMGPELSASQDAVVLIEGERIRAAGSRDEIPVPPDARVVKMNGATLSPGFIDAHVHIGLADPGDVVARGVTTVRDLGWPADEIHALARGSGAASFEGPEVLAAGPILTADGGYPARSAWAPEGTAREIEDPQAAVWAVERTADEGACVIKIALNPPVGPTLDADTLGALVTAAHERGLRVTGHIHGLDELEKALDAGVDELAHMLMSDEDLPDETIRRMIGRGMVVVPTLSIRFGEERSSAIRNLARFRAAGGRLVYGTDLGNEGPGPGIDPLEVTAMAEAGMTPLDIIRSATVGGAEWLGLRDRGSIEPGKLADIVAFDGAIDGPEDLCRVAKVWRRGVERAG
jgi:imidazolonepropionase-like amidohydrolase